MSPLQSPPQNPPDVSALDSLIGELQSLVDRTIDEGSRIGYFASLYTRITIAVRQAILAGAFADGAAVARLDAAFARRYLTAVTQHQQVDSRISLPWGVAMRVIDRGNLSIVQHMALAINAHINFDLGLATFECCGAQTLAAMKGDFVKVNEVLASVVAEVENEIALVSPIVRLIERFGSAITTRIIDFGLFQARAFAWRFAQMLADADATARPRLIDQKAEEVALICGAITQDRLRNGGFALVAAVEVKDVRRVIRTFDHGLSSGRSLSPGWPLSDGNPPRAGSGVDVPKARSGL
jgi:hypothetical protein